MAMKTQFCFSSLASLADYLTDRAAQKRDNATHTKITKQHQRELITEDCLL